MKTKFILFALAFLLISFFSCNKKEIKRYAPAIQKTDAIAEWESLRFGAFVHFNDNTCLVSEFSKNTDPSIFNPVNLNFDTLMTTFQKAGVKYAVLTTRHTSGFCLWDSKVTEFDVANSPFKKDVVKLFVDACRKHDIKPCLYYCLWGSKTGILSPGIPRSRMNWKELRRNKSSWHNSQNWLKIMEIFMNFGSICNAGLIQR